MNSFLAISIGHTLHLAALQHQFTSALYAFGINPALTRKFLK